MGSRAGATLRTVTYRLSSTPPTHLPNVLPPITQALLDCKPVLSSSPSFILNTPDGVALHKFKTQLSTLLNDNKQSSARWAAVILIKAAVDLGGWEILQANGGLWVRGLLGILGRATEPPATRRLCIVTLTRIFLLTQEYPTLIREITTPSLPTFATACLSLVGASKNAKASNSNQTGEAQAQFLVPVLRSFEYLLPHHPTIFRTFLPLIQPLLLALVAPTPSQSTQTLSENDAHATIDLEVATSAQSLLCLLSFCAPKSSSSQEWETTFLHLIADTHATCNAVFRSVVEDWISSASIVIPHVATANDVLSQDDSTGGFPSWTGIYAGCERLSGLLDLIQTFVLTKTAAEVTFPMGRVTDLIVRITSVAAPSNRSSTSSSDMRTNDQIGKEERDSLWSSLPSIHVAALSVVQALCERFGNTLLPVLPMLFEQTTWVFRRGNFNAAVREECYILITSLVQLYGEAMSKEQVSSLEIILKRCCADILPAPESTTAGIPTTISSSAQNGAKTNKAPTLNADAFLPTTTSTTQPTADPLPLADAAYAFLTAAFTHIPAYHISQSLRTQMDRTAVLGSHLPAMLASTLNPPPNNVLAKSYSSILPLLARAHPGALEVEALLRPRLPALVGGGRGKERNIDSDVEGEEEEDELDQDTGIAGFDDLPPIAEITTDSTTQPGTVETATANELGISTSENMPLLGQNPVPEPISTAMAQTGTTAGFIPQDPATVFTPPEEALVTRKRGLASVDSAEAETKRARFSPIESHTISSAHAPVDMDEYVSSVPLPVTVPTLKDENQHGTIATIPVAETGLVAAENNSDSDDFEIPELNMDPDTEDDEDELGQS